MVSQGEELVQTEAMDKATIIAALRLLLDRLNNPTSIEQLLWDIDLAEKLELCHLRVLLEEFTQLGNVVRMNNLSPYHIQKLRNLVNNEIAHRSAVLQTMRYKPEQRIKEQAMVQDLRDIMSILEKELSPELTPEQAAWEGYKHRNFMEHTMTGFKPAQIYVGDTRVGWIEAIKVFEKLFIAGWKAKEVQEEQ